MKLLHLNASPRGSNSRTLQISSAFLERLTAHAAVTVTELDLTNEPLPAIGNTAAEAKYQSIQGVQKDGAAASIWEKIEGYAHQFIDSDIYLISCPMWNFSIPYMLKHYIDVIVQPGLLFKFSEGGVVGLAQNKKMVCITSRGSNYKPDSFLHAYDFQEPYIRAIFGMTGISDVTFIHAEPMDYTPEITQTALHLAMEQAKHLADDMLLQTNEYTGASVPAA